MRYKIIIGLVFLFCLIVIGLLASYITYGIIYDKVYEQAYQEGQASIILEVQQGQIPILAQQENETILNWYDIREICGVGQ